MKIVRIIRLQGADGVKVSNLKVSNRHVPDRRDWGEKRDVRSIPPKVDFFALFVFTQILLSGEAGHRTRAVKLLGAEFQLQISLFLTFANDNFTLAQTGGLKLTSFSSTLANVKYYVLCRIQMATK